MAQTPLNTAQPTQDALFTSKLRHIYKQQDKIAPLIEGVIPEQSMKKYYVKLQTIIKEDKEEKSTSYEAVTGEKKEIEIAKLFDKIEGMADSKEANKILILGGAGVGKSTLMQYMAYKWSQDEIWTGRFDYVYRVTLKTVLNPDWARDYNPTELKTSELRCLAHYHLTQSFTRAERAKSQAEDLAWPSDKSRVLLLLDGYDEVAHLRHESRARDLFEEIFEHNNIVLTSRPNAVDDEMKRKFDRKIENTGLDDEGVEQYLALYFSNMSQGALKGDQLKQFLKINSSIRDICKVPVNIAMLCYIWSEAGGSAVLQSITNMSDLYKQVVDQLGFRYYSKWQYKGAIQEGKDLKTKWKQGAIQLDEITVLEHVAYKGMTGGGMDVADEKRAETLIIKGAISLKDQEGISICSSINKLAASLQRKDLGVEEIYRYGVLKAEGAATRHEQSNDTELQHQSYSFIHLTFQEYLTASYFRSKLLHGSQQEKEQVCQYIAEHRNEPRYLMTLKFLAGIITSDTASQEAGEAVRMFWEAVTCNVDGVLELGVENKATLLMHLLSQAKNSGDKDDANTELDSRIPNKDTMTDLIDIVVLRNVVKWGSILKSADYMTVNIKEALEEALYGGKFEQSGRIKQILSRRVHEPSAAISLDEQRNEWEHSDEKEGGRTSALRAAVEKVTKARANMEDLIEERRHRVAEEAATVENTEDDNNRSESQMIDILSNLINKLSPEEQAKFMNYLTQIIATRGKHDWQLVRMAIESLMKMQSSVQMSILQAKELITVLSELTGDLNLNETSVKAGTMLIKRVSAADKSESDKMVEIMKNKMIVLFAAPESAVRCAAVSDTVEILKLHLNSNDAVESLLDKIAALFADPDSHVRHAAVSGAVEVLKLHPRSNNAVQSLLDKMAALFADSDLNVRYTAVWGALDVLKLHPSSNDAAQSLLDKMAALFADPDSHVRRTAVSGAVEVLKLHPSSNDAVQSLLDKMAALFADPDLNVRGDVVSGAVEVLKLHPNSNDAAQSLLDKMAALFTHSDSNIRYTAVLDAAELLNLQMSSNDVARSLLDKIAALFADSDSAVRRAAVSSAVEVLRLHPSNNDAVPSLFGKMAALFADPDWTVRRAAASDAVEVLKLHSSNSTVQSLLDKMTDLFSHSTFSVRQSAGEVIAAAFSSNLFISTAELIKYLNHPNKDIRGEVIQVFTTSLTTLLALSVPNTTITQLDVEQNQMSNPQTNTHTDPANHELLKPLLAIVGYDNLTTIDEDKKHLINLAKKLINFQLQHLSEHKLRWLNDHFTELASLSTESRAIFTQIYHQILQDSHLSATDEELIIKFIEAGLTTSLTRRGEVIFEGKKYKLRNANIEALLERIARAVISRNNDILANQYRSHKPIFPKSDGVGMRRATCDIEKITSILSRSRILDNERWVLTSLVQEGGDPKKEMLLLEQRSSIGDHIIYMVSADSKSKLHLNSAVKYYATMQSIFGIYKEKTVYNAYTKLLSGKEGRKIVEQLFRTVDAVAEKNQKTALIFSDITVECEDTQKYFQQELLGLGHEDRFSYIDRRLDETVTNNSAALQHALSSCKPKLRTDEVEKLAEYYKAFLLTFSSLYTTSQAVDSGQLSLDTSNLTATVLSTLVSFAPFGIGEKLSSGIDMINDFLTSNKMANDAKLVKKLAADAVELSVIVGDVGRRIVLNKTAQKKIVSAVDADPSGILGRLKVFVDKNKEKLGNYNLAEKELHKTPQAALGENDANKLIAEWLSQNKRNAISAMNTNKDKALAQAQDPKPKKSTLYLGMSNEELIAEFTRLILGDEVVSPSKGSDKSPGKKTDSKITPEETVIASSNNGKSACCEIF